VSAAIKGIIFDLDGVLVHTDDLHFEAWSGIAERLGITFTEEDNNRLRGVSRMESLEILLSLGDVRLTDDEKLALATEKNDEYVRLLARLTTADGDPDVIATIAGLREAGIRLAIGSSSKNAVPILEAIGLLGEFDAIADGTTIANSKPHPEVFLQAAEKLGLEPGKCLVVEDAFAGVDAALAGGFPCAAIGDATAHEGVTWTLQTLPDLLEIVKR
jgi:beta-phosphoglucomutase